jgi:hypothetical protein
MDMPRTSIWRPPRILSDADARSTFQHAILCWITQDTELKVFDRLKFGPAEEIGDEDDTGHGVEFFGGGACDFAEICGQLRDGHFSRRICRNRPCHPPAIILRPAGVMSP